MKNSSTISTPLFLSSDEEVSTLRDAHPELVEVDAFERQLKELFFIENRSFIGTEKAQVYTTEEFRQYAESKANNYVLVYFPWNNTLVKTVCEDDYFLLRTNRNQDLITHEEQLKLRDFRVAIFGMSVGSNIAFVLAQAGIANNMIIADYDQLDTTNLNRILAGVHEIGLDKTDVVARKIYEGNPYAQLTCLDEGINEGNLESLLQNKSIDCIVEEIDDINFKIHARVLAMKYNVPVIMVTDNGDGIVLHVERYDLGHDKIWGKTHEHYEEKLAGGALTKEQSGEIIMHDIVGGVHRVDERMIESVKRVIAKELVSWSQLGSAAVLGGVVVTYIIKKMVLNQLDGNDIRNWISPEEVVKGNHSNS